MSRVAVRRIRAGRQAVTTRHLDSRLRPDRWKIASIFRRLAHRPDLFPETHRHGVALDLGRTRPRKA